MRRPWGGLYLGAGDLVLLADQDRSLGDGASIRRAEALLPVGPPRGRGGRYFGKGPECRLLRARLAALTAPEPGRQRGQPTGLPAVQSAQLRFQSPKPSVGASGTSVPVTRTTSPRPKLS